ncbi:class I SAM-dependent methyltransferase [Laspinema palackyanum]|uniref:class I SAM-dependent methyltransferase n=1 Tax=Laspinema palackyanum TaxID=3231601 RepID=UPI00345CEE46|nr:class I SAM-dependent methyltransferase [Laspinema sp. D2c]
MRHLKALVKQTFPDVIIFLTQLKARKLKNKPIDKIFVEIYTKNTWKSPLSRSGTGSELLQTSTIQQAIPIIIEQLNIQVVVDAPCGDFHWMKEVKLDVLKYIGVDIVPILINENHKRYSNDKREFLVKNIISDPLPISDLIICRDCLVHLSFEDAIKSLKNFKQSGAKYLMTTTFIDCQINRDIITGNWRPLNLELPPFNFPKPIKLINEKCTEGSGTFSDKSLGIWDLQSFEIK